MTPAAPFDLGPLPTDRRMRTVDERVVRGSPARIFELARDVEQWPAHLPHYRWVRFRERRSDGGGIVEMAANRPFGPVNWPTWWLSEMQVVDRRGSLAPPSSRFSPLSLGAIRFRHIGGVTRGMEVEWSFTPEEGALAPNQAHEATRVRIVHLWDGPDWQVVGGAVAVHVIGPVFVHGIASRTLAGLAAIAERDAWQSAEDGVAKTMSRSGIPGADE